MREIDQRKDKFLRCLEKHARGERIGRLFKLVKDWFDTHSIGDDGISDIEITFPRSGDMGDEIFNVMYNVDMDLRCAAGVRTQEYRYKPKTIDGVVYVAVENPLDIHWRVNIGAISLDETDNEDEKQ
ncbi:MAG: hypothetical protein IJG84_11350 [Kiritimatiellae bacterium]|nr:hypothetical protein [Kiritimatiellia bacterium]